MSNRFKSRKFWLAVTTPLVIMVARKLGVELSDTTTTAIAGVVSAYILGEAYVDSRRKQKK